MIVYTSTKNEWKYHFLMDQLKTVYLEWMLADNLYTFISSILKGFQTESSSGNVKGKCWSLDSCTL